MDMGEDLNSHGDERDIRRSATRSIQAGYIVASTAGFALARYLAKAPRAKPWRPNLLGQAAITIAAAYLGGGIYAVTKQKETALKLVEARGPVSARVCAALQKLEPCLRDQECRSLVVRTRLPVPIADAQKVCEAARTEERRRLFAYPTATCVADEDTPTSSGP